MKCHQMLEITFVGTWSNFHVKRVVGESQIYDMTDDTVTLRCDSLTADGEWYEADRFELDSWRKHIESRLIDLKLFSENDAFQSCSIRVWNA